LPFFFNIAKLVLHVLDFFSCWEKVKSYWLSK
jgi:hypothetical protein